MGTTTASRDADVGMDGDGMSHFGGGNRMCRIGLLE